MVFMNAVQNGLSAVISWTGAVVRALVNEAGPLNELLPLLAIGVAISALMLGIKAIKSFIWGA